MTLYSRIPGTKLGGLYCNPHVAGDYKGMIEDSAGPNRKKHTRY